MGRFSSTRALFAEWLGTALLLATVIGSGIMAERLAGGNVAIALMANTIATGAILVVLITMLAPVSGAHLNPAVSLAFALRREITWPRCGAYVILQVLGGIAGMLAAHLMFEEPLWQLSQKIRTGGAQWFSEGIATFGLVLTILATLRARPAAVPMAVGLYITAAYWFTASTSFANPAVTVARSLTDTFAGILPGHAPMFIAAQFAGSLVAVAVCAWLFTGDDPGRTE